GSVIASEVVAALALLVVRPRWIGLAMSFVLLGLFTLYLLKLLWSDDRVSCGCAGAGGNPVSWIHVVRNVVLMVLTGAAWLCTPTNGVSLAAHLTLAVPAAAVGVL